MFACYETEYPFSVELTGAVLRQGRFIKKMVKLGWTQKETVEREGSLEPLTRAVARYHAFLHMMSGVSSFVLRPVPTLVSVRLCCTRP